MLEALTLLTKPLIDLRSASQVMRWYCMHVATTWHGQGCHEAGHALVLHVRAHRGWVRVCQCCWAGGPPRTQATQVSGDSGLHVAPRVCHARRPQSQAGLRSFVEAVKARPRALNGH